MTFPWRGSLERGRRREGERRRKRGGRRQIVMYRDMDSTDRERGSEVEVKVGG